MTDTAPAPTLEKIRERLGYVVVTFNQAGYQDLASGDVLYDDRADAVACRDDEQARSAKHGRKDRHVLAEVFEVPEDAEKAARVRLIDSIMDTELPRYAEALKRLGDGPEPGSTDA